MSFNNKKLSIVFIFAAAMLLFLNSPATCVTDDDIMQMQKESQGREEAIANKIKAALKEHGYQTGTEPIDIHDVSSIQKIIQKQDESDKNSGGGITAMNELYWFFVIFISVVGMGFFSVGKKNGDFYFMASGMVMMIYPYFVTGTAAMVLLGTALTILPFLQFVKR